MLSISSFLPISRITLTFLGFAALSIALAVPSVVTNCTQYSGPEFVCMYRYASVMPPGFERVVINSVSNSDNFSSTIVPGDTAFRTVSNATFLIWDQVRAAQVLGQNPSYSFMFTVNNAGHEAPVYVY